MNIDLARECSSPELLMFLGITKNILRIIQIIVPILLIIFASIEIIKLVQNPERKNGPKPIINKFIAAVFIFLIPTVINATMGLLGINTNLSTCWTNADEFKFRATTYTPMSNEERKKILYDAKLYEAGSSKCGEKIARLAVELAGTASPDSFIKSPDGSNYCAFNKSNDPRLAKYNQVHDSRVSCNHAYASCTQAAATIIDAAADPEINWMGPKAQLYYLQHSKKWEELTKPAGSKWIDVLEPGDVGEYVSDESKGTGHSWIYVGNEIAREKFPKTDGYLFEGGYSVCKNPHIDPSEGLVGTGNNIHYFRFIGDCSEADTKNVKDGPGGPTGYTC